MNLGFKTLIMAKVKERIVDVEYILSKLSPEQKETTQNLRALIKSTVPETTETVKNGNPTFKIGTKDFVWIIPFQNHVDLEFSMGASLDSDLLRSRGNEKPENKRHVTIRDFEEVKPELTRLLKEAASLGFEHCTPT